MSTNAETAVRILNQWEFAEETPDNMDAKDLLIEAGLYHIRDHVNLRPAGAQPLLVTALTFDDNSVAIKVEQYVNGLCVSHRWSASVEGPIIEDLHHAREAIDRSPALSRMPWSLVEQEQGSQGIEDAHGGMIALVRRPADAQAIAEIAEMIESLRESVAAMKRMDRELLRLSGASFETEKGEVARAEALLNRIAGGAAQPACDPNEPGSVRLPILYPSWRVVDPETIRTWASDSFYNNADRYECASCGGTPGPDCNHNGWTPLYNDGCRKPVTLVECIEWLEDQGEVTFHRDAMAIAEFHDSQAQTAGPTPTTVLAGPEI